MAIYPKTRREQEIWQVCDDLISMGKTPRELTGEALAVRLRELRYKAGSTTQRYQYRDSWMAARGISKEEHGSINTAELTDPITRATLVFKEGLERELRQEYEQKYQHLETQLTEKTDELAVALKTIETLEFQLTAEKKAHQLLQQQYALKTEDYSVLHEKNIGLKMQVTELTKQMELNNITYEKNLERYKLHQEETALQLKDTVAQLNLAMEARISDVKEMAENHRHRYIVEIDNYKINEANLREALSKQQIENEQLHRQLTELKTVDEQIDRLSATSYTILETLQSQAPQIRDLITQQCQQLVLLPSIDENVMMTTILLEKLVSEISQCVLEKTQAKMVEVID